MRLKPKILIDTFRTVRTATVYLGSFVHYYFLTFSFKKTITHKCASHVSLLFQLNLSQPQHSLLHAHFMIVSGGLC